METVYNGASALEAIAQTRFDLIVLDLMLPDLSGLEIAKRLKQKRATAIIPIIMLTAKVEEEDILTGFELKANDYVTKPFSPKVLVARINSVLRQIEAMPEKDIIKEPCKGLLIFPLRHETYVDNVLIDLTPTELELLVVLVEHPGWEVKDIPLVNPNKPLIDEMAREFGEITESRVTIINRLGHVSGDSSGLPEWAINYPPRKELNVWKEGDMLVDIRDNDVTGKKPCLWPHLFTLTASLWASVVRQLQYPR